MDRIDFVSDRIGDWVPTLSGVRFFPFDPRPEDFDLGDIGHGLSNLCRYNGQCSEFYSVAQRSKRPTNRFWPPNIGT